MPGLQGEFVDLLGTGDSAGRECEPAGEELDVEDPATRERFGQDGPQLLGDAEQFCPALRVVDGHRENGRSGRGEDAAEIVSDVAATNVSAEQVDAGAEHEVGVRVLREDVDEPRDLVERVARSASQYPTRVAPASMASSRPVLTASAFPMLRGM